MNGILDPQILGILAGQQGGNQGIDPKTAGILSMGMGLLATNGGPNAAGSFGNAIGKSGMQGLHSFQVADEARRQNARSDGLLQLERIKALQGMQALAMQAKKLGREEEFFQMLRKSMEGQANAGQAPQQAAQYDAGTGQFRSAPTPPQAPGAAPGQFPVSLQQAMLGKVGAGVDVLPFLKENREQNAIKIENGYIVQNGKIIGTVPQTNQQGFSTQAMPDGQGGYRIQGVPGGAALYGQQQDIMRGSEARHDLVTVPPTSAGSPPTFQSRASLLPGAGVAGAPQDAAGTSPSVPPVTATANPGESDPALQARFLAARQAAGIRPMLAAGAAPQAAGMSPRDTADQAARAEQQKLAAKTFNEQYTGAVNATMQNPGKIASLNRITTLLDGFEGGKLSGFGFELARLGNSLGLKIDERLSDKEAAEAAGKELALQLRGTADGGGMPGALSDSDREFLRAMTPQMAQTDKGRKEIAGAKRKLLEREMEVGQMAMKYHQRHGVIDNEFFIKLNAWSNANPIFGK